MANDIGNVMVRESGRVIEQVAEQYNRDIIRRLDSIEQSGPMSVITEQKMRIENLER